MRHVGIKSLFGAMVAAACAVVALAAPGIAQASPITLGSAASYALLAGPKDAVTFGGAMNISGNFGVGASGSIKYQGTDSISGNVYKDSGVSTSGSARVSGSTITQSMTTAMNDATTASTDAAALTATKGLTDQGGSITVGSGQSVTIKAMTNLSENVLDISSLSLTNGTLTFDDNGFTGAKFIVNITGNFTVSSSGALKSIIQGINGASASDIIFNIEGTSSSAVSITGNSTNAIIGTILAPQRNVSLSGGGTLTGALLAGVNSAGKSYTVTEASSGFNINGFAYVPQSTVHTPEPPSIAVYGVGIGALLMLRRRRRRNARA
jgi:hypothetical protein